MKWTRDDGWYPRATVPNAGANGAPPTPAASASTNTTRRRAREANPTPVAPRTTPTAPPTVVTVEGESRRPRRSVFVADTLRPRAVHHLDARARDVQLQGRTLWLSLHGEAHFRSLRVRDPVTEEEVAALARTKKEAAGSAGAADGGGTGAAAGVGQSASARNGQEVRMYYREQQLYLVRVLPSAAAVPFVCTTECSSCTLCVRRVFVLRTLCLCGCGGDEQRSGFLSRFVLKCMLM